jgi:outer membrane protein assembly factor BamB
MGILYSQARPARSRARARSRPAGNSRGRTPAPASGLASRLRRILRGPGSGGGVPKAALLAAAVLGFLLVAAIVLVLSKGSSGPAFDGSGSSNGNLSNTRYEGGPIDSATVARLHLAWTLPFTAKSQFGSDASTPIIANGVIYSQDLASNVQAIELKTGKVLWTKSYELPDHGPNGLVVAHGRVFGATPTAVFALDERTGQQIWSVTLVQHENQEGGIDMAPGYHDGIVYVSTLPGDFGRLAGGEGVGVLWALDWQTGRRLWHFNTVPEDLWSAQHTQINSGGGAWYTPAFDDQGFMYIGIANPEPEPGTSQFPWGSSRPGPDLYTDSLLKLDAATGKLQWYYQLTPHDLYDHDLQDPPILVNAKGTQMVIEAGKGGIVLGIDRQSGKLLWSRAVGIHNGHDHDSIYAMKHEYSKLRLPETVYPGQLGGVIAPMATNGSTVFVPVVNFPVTYAANQSVAQEGPSATGELVALNTATGAVLWDHKFSAPAFSGVTVVNDVVFTATFNGALYAFDAATGSVLWEAQLPAGTNAGIAVNGETLVAPAGSVQAAGQSPELVAYRLE